MWEQFRMQVIKANQLYPPTSTADEQVPQTPFKNLKEALKFGVSFNSRLIDSLAETCGLNDMLRVELSDTEKALKVQTANFESLLLDN